MKDLSGYHFYMDRMRSEGSLIFWCGCGRAEGVTEDMPMRQMRCDVCKRYMIIMDKEDKP